MRLAALLAAAAIVFAAPAFAGGWISGGTGELTGDGGNPWFLALPEQPATITYCIDADLDGMGVTSEDLARAVSGSISYWTRELATAAYAPSARPDVRVRYENFVPSGRPCDDSEDLAFQFGRLSTPLQKKVVEDEHIDLRHYIGFAQRTAYDATLRGKGFIYIAPESGPLRPEGEGLLSGFWGRDARLRLHAVVRHELGHVFGVPHFGTPQSLMGQSFPETAVTASLSTGFLSTSFGPTLRAGDGVRLDRCFQDGLPVTVVKALRLAASDRCLRFTSDGDGMRIDAAESLDWPRRPVARFTLSDTSVRERLHEVVRIWLPQKRSVLLDVPADVRILGGPAVVETMMSGRLGSNPASLIIDPLTFQLGTVVDGVAVPDLLDGISSTWQRPASRR